MHPKLWLSVSTKVDISNWLLGSTLLWLLDRKNYKYLPEMGTCLKFPSLNFLTCECFPLILKILWLMNNVG